MMVNPVSLLYRRMIEIHAAHWVYMRVNAFPCVWVVRPAPPRRRR